MVAMDAISILFGQLYKLKGVSVNYSIIRSLERILRAYSFEIGSIWHFESIDWMRNLSLTDIRRIMYVMRHIISLNSSSQIHHVDTAEMSFFELYFIGQ